MAPRWQDVCESEPIHLYISMTEPNQPEGDNHRLLVPVHRSVIGIDLMGSVGRFVVGVMRDNTSCQLADGMRTCCAASLGGRSVPNTQYLGSSIYEGRSGVKREGEEEGTQPRLPELPLQMYREPSAGPT